MARLSTDASREYHKESDSVTSFILSPTDGQPLPLFQAGQFIVLRLLVDPGKSPVLRSYSLSDLPAADHFRISVKNELNGIGSSFLCGRAREGDLLDVSAPRGSFTLRPSQGPVVLLSAGVGATPVMSMLHTLAAEKSQREVWWIYGARNRLDHPFAEESRSLLKQLARGREYIVYSRPAAIDQVGADFDAPGHIDTALLEKIGLSQGSDFYLCGPSSFLQNIQRGPCHQTSDRQYRSHAYRRARSAMSYIGLSLPHESPHHNGKEDIFRQVSGTSDASKTQLGLTGSWPHLANGLSHWGGTVALQMRAYP